MGKRDQDDPATDQWYQLYKDGGKPTAEPCLAVDIVGGTAKIRILEHTDASGEGWLPSSTTPIPTPRSPVQKAWILRRGWDKVSESYGVRPSDFPVNPWVLYCPKTHHLYLSKCDQSTPPADQWYQLYMYRSREPTEEPGVAVEIVDGKARIIDTRKHADTRRFSGEECILVRDSEEPSDDVETELVRRISSLLNPLPHAWTISDGLTAAQRLPLIWKKEDQAHGGPYLPSSLGTCIPVDETYSVEYVTTFGPNCKSEGEYVELPDNYLNCSGLPTEWQFDGPPTPP